MEEVWREDPRERKSVAVNVQRSIRAMLINPRKLLARQNFTSRLTLIDKHGVPWTFTTTIIPCR
jgi:hypothetical protein